MSDTVLNPLTIDFHLGRGNFPRRPQTRTADVTDGVADAVMADWSCSGTRTSPTSLTPWRRVRASQLPRHRDVLIGAVPDIGAEARESSLHSQIDPAANSVTKTVFSEKRSFEECLVQPTSKHSFLSLSRIRNLGDDQHCMSSRR